MPAIRRKSPSGLFLRGLINGKNISKLMDKYIPLQIHEWDKDAEIDSYQSVI